MKIAKGIKGIRKFLKNEKVGWHVYSDAAYLGYFDKSVNEVLEMWALEGYQVIGFTGNGIQIEYIGK